MPATQYNDGSKYGDADAIYGRISSGLLEAQVDRTRETGLQVRVIDERTNQWESVNALGSISTGEFYDEAQAAGGSDMDSRSPFYVFYRGFSHLVKLDNGTIVRIRVGTPGDYNDRQVYIQEVTDPSVAAQWQAWTLLYSGTHFAAIVVPLTASTYDVYHTKSGIGLCKNNVLLWATATNGADLGTGIRITIPEGVYSPRHLTITIPTSYPQDSVRVLDLYVTANADTTQPVASKHNFKWSRNTSRICADPFDSNYWIHLRSFQLNSNPRVSENGESLTVTRVPAFNTEVMDPPPLLIRGLATEAGHNTIGLAGMFRASDGFIYVFYYELHTDDQFAFTQDAGPGIPIFWQRSKNGIHWSESVVVGFDLPNREVGAFEFDHAGETYVYLCGNGSVVRRPTEPIEYVLDNYVPAVQLDLPRDNQLGSGSVVVANPNNVHSEIIGLSDRRIRILPGIKTADTGNYEYQEFSDLWLKKVTEESEKSVSRLHLQIGDIWARLSNQLRDTFNIIGKTEWSDWSPSGRNQPFNYFFEGAEGSIVGTTLSTIGLCLWSGWKGHNPDFQFDFTVPAFGSIEFYARYVDLNNHIKFEYSVSGGLTIDNVIDGVISNLFDASIGANKSHFRVVMKWAEITVYANHVVVATITNSTNTNPVVKSGYVGWSGGNSYVVSNFVFSDWEYDITSHDLVKFALAMGDYHDVVVGGPNNRQYALAWGPQTDVPTAADGLRNVLKAEKLELVWRDGFIEVGRFTDQSVFKVLEDEIISFNYQEQSSERLNLAIVDGNEHRWLKVDVPDTQQRDRQIVGYFDIPELMDQASVRSRAEEEIRRGSQSQSPGGLIPLLFDLWRMDVVEWIDNRGTSQVARIEGIKISINQSDTPSQREELDMSIRE